MEDFIDEPKPKHDKKAISKIAEEVKKFYNNTLLSEFCNDLRHIEQSTTDPAKPYPQRLIKYFEHIKSAVKFQLDNNDEFTKLEANLGKNMSMIVKALDKSENEKKLDIVKLKTDFHDKVYKIIKESDAKLDQHIDLTPTAHIDDDGLYLATHNESYITTKGNSKIVNDNTYFKVSGAPTLNQHLIQQKELNTNKLKETITKLNDDIVNIDKYIGIGLFATTERIINLVNGLTQLKEMWRLKEFTDTGGAAGHVPQFNVNRINEIIKTSHHFLVKQTKFQNTFNDRYLMKYDAANDLDVTAQNAKNNNNQFDEKTLNGMKVDFQADYSLNKFTNGQTTLKLNPALHNEFWSFVDKDSEGIS